MTGYAMFVEGWNAAIMWLLRHDSPTLRMAGDTMVRDASTQDAWRRHVRDAAATDVR